MESQPPEADEESQSTPLLTREGSQPGRQRAPSDASPETVLEPPSTSDNFVPSTLILSKAIIGAGIAALPVTNALLGWPLASAALLLMAWATFVTLRIIVRLSARENTPSYVELVHKLLGHPTGLALEVAVVAFGVGLLLVYEVIAADMLAGKPGFKGLLCQALGHWRLGRWACSRWAVAGLVTLTVLLPSVSVRTMQGSSLASTLGMACIAIWAASSVLLFAAAAVQGRIRGDSLVPDWRLLGGSPWRVFANAFAIVPVFTTAFSVQATAPFVLAEVKPGSVVAKERVTSAALALTAGLFLLISLASYAVFGPSCQSDILQDYTPAALEPLVGARLGGAIYVIARLSFLASVVTLFPLMVFPTRDGLLRLTVGEVHLSRGYFLAVTYGLVAVIYAVSIVTPSIFGPLQIVGATAGAMIGFIAPGMLALLPTDAQLTRQASRWSRAPGYGLIALGVLQCVTGVGAQFMSQS